MRTKPISVGGLQTNLNDLNNSKNFYTRGNVKPILDSKNGTFQCHADALYTQIQKCFYNYPHFNLFVCIDSSLCPSNYKFI